jgi:hypothetical protein
MLIEPQGKGLRGRQSETEKSVGKEEDWSAACAAEREQFVSFGPQAHFIRAKRLGIS